MSIPAYARYGFAHLTRVLEPGQCDALLDAAREQERIVMPHRTIPAFLLGMRMLGKYARYALDDEAVSGLGSDYFSVSAGFPTHTDNDFVQALPGSFTSAWLALADVHEGNGPLVIGGRAIMCSKGDALLIDGDTPHRSCAGHGQRPVALFTYIKTGFPFRRGNTQCREEVALCPPR